MSKKQYQPLTEETRGIYAEIYGPVSDRRDYPLSMIGTKHKEVFVPCDGGNWTVRDAIRMEIPVCTFVRRDLFGSEYIHLEPYQGDYDQNHEAKDWFMMDGLFVYDCDSRFRNVAKYPVPLHDRVER